MTGETSGLLSGFFLTLLLYGTLCVLVSSFGRSPFRLPRNWRAFVSPDEYWRWLDKQKETP